MGLTQCGGLNGTIRGYMWHQRNKTSACIGCATAWRQYQQRAKNMQASGLHSWPQCGAPYPYTAAGYTWHTTQNRKPCFGCEIAHTEFTKRATA